MPRVAPSTVAAQKRSLRVLRAEFFKRKGDLRDMVDKKRAILNEVREKIRKLEAEVKEAQEEVSEEFDSGSSLFPGSSSESDSSDSPPPVPKKAAAPSPKGKSGPPKKSPDGKGAPAKKKKDESEVKERKARTCRPRIPPGEEAPNHRGSPNAEGLLYPGFDEDDRRYCPACEQLRRGFPNATRAHRPKEMPCPWAPVAGKS